VTIFHKVLVANRGEIAIRIFRSIHDMGLQSVAVYSEAENDALHVSEANESVCIGPANASASYLSIEAIITAAQQTNSDAIHPGYGFLSENPDLAEACAKHGIKFIGPSATAIRAMGNKANARSLMLESGVPCVPGYEGQERDPAALTKCAKEIGFPLLVKATMGGGGRAMAAAHSPDEFVGIVEQVRAEATNLFGSDEVILERLVQQPRHVEVQIFADSHGNVVSLGERECTVQRRRQKVIEEAPCSSLQPETRELMEAAAVRAAKAIKYEGAGTVEFLLDEDGSFYFLEMNTRIQVEHPVTEMVTGIDLIALQLKVAAGETLPPAEDLRQINGHAMEARIYAEDPSREFLPQVGTISTWLPPKGDGVRVDCGVQSGQTMTPYYDPLVAKIITHGATRDLARKRLARALRECVVLGVPTNRQYIQSILEHPDFIADQIDTNFIETRCMPSSNESDAPPAPAIGLAAVLFSLHPGRSWDGWTSTGPSQWPMQLLVEEGSDCILQLRVTQLAARRFHITSQTGDADETTEFEFALLRHQGPMFEIRTDKVSQVAHATCADNRLHLQVAGRNLAITDTTYEIASGDDESAQSGHVAAAMAGQVVEVIANIGDVVAAGDPLLVIEAMKLAHKITAPIAGTVTALQVQVGKQVQNRMHLATIEPSTSD